MVRSRSRPNPDCYEKSRRYTRDKDESLEMKEQKDMGNDAATLNGLKITANQTTRNEATLM